jgi:hypothetical protein
MEAQSMKDLRKSSLRSLMPLKRIRKRLIYEKKRMQKSPGLLMAIEPVLQMSPEI